MKKKARIIAILGVLCLLLVGYVVVKNVSSETETDGEGIVLSSIEPENITSFSYQHYDDEEYDDKVYSFEKKDGFWYYTDDMDFPVSQVMAITKVQVISQITAERVVEENAKDIGQYGLDVPYLTVSVSDGNETYTYHVGDYNESTTTYYIMQEGNDTVYLADANLFIAFDVQIWDMIEIEAMPELDSEVFTEVVFEFPDETIKMKKAKLEKDYVKAQWYLVDDKSQIITNTNTVNTQQYPKYIPTLSELREVDYKYDESKAKEYGFDNPTLEITVKYDVEGASKQIVITIGAPTSESNIYEDYYIMTSESDAVLTIEGSQLETLLTMDKNSMLSN